MSKTNESSRGGMANLLCICKAVQCPYDSPNGCQRYLVSSHCHIAYPSPGTGVERLGVAPLASQYWLYGQVNVIDMDSVKADQAAWLSDPEEIKRIEMMKRFED